MAEKERSGTKRLVRLVLTYFGLYTGHLIPVKLLTDKQPDPTGGKPLPPEIPPNDFLYGSTLGGGLAALLVCLLGGWGRLKAEMVWDKKLLGIRLDYWLMALTGFSTSLIVVTTTAMYLLMSPLLAMLMMRALVIMVTRGTDAAHKKMGVLDKPVKWQENVAVGLALLAAFVAFWWGKQSGGAVEIKHSWLAIGVLALYFVSYGVALFCRNLWRHLFQRRYRRYGDNAVWFVREQTATGYSFLCWAALAGVLVKMNVLPEHVINLDWRAIATGTLFGFLAPVSVFLFMFEGRTATMAGLANRLTSLVASVAAVTLLWVWWHRSPPKPNELASLVIILIAFGMLTWAEIERNREQAAERAAKAPA